MASIHDRIAALDEFSMPDDQRTIEGASFSINYSSVAYTNFIDRNAFDSKFLNDMYHISKMRSILERGEYFVNIIYTYRSCSKALPQLKSSDDPNKGDLHSKTFEVLEPEIQKVKDLYQFQNDTIDFLCDQIEFQTSNERKTEVIPEGFLWYMIKLLDLLALLDALLNMKACLVTDFSFYKRAFGFIKPNETTQDKLLAKQGLFLAQQNRITIAFQERLQKIPHFDDIILLMVNMCATYIETDRYVLPADKHSLLRVMPYGLFLMDSGECNIFKSKKINLKRFAAIFKKYPVVTLYGDMQIKLESMVKAAPNFSPTCGWPTITDERMAREYEIIHHLPSIRQQHTEYMGKFHTLINSIKKDDAHHSDAEFSAEVTGVLLEGLLLISNWSSRILQQSAWKYSKPSTEGDGQHLVENSYEQVVRRNYSTAECLALCEIIGLTKGLASRMMQEDGILSPFIRCCIHQEIQKLIHTQINDMLDNATKKRRPIKVDLLQIKNIAIDNFDGSFAAEEGAKKKKKVNNDTMNDIKSRPVSPSSTQLEILRTSVYNLFAVRMNGKRPFEKDLSKDAIKTLEDFYSRSFYYPYLVDFKDSITQMVDFGDLWYREFYLELTKRLQFPIEWSLPWILAETILDSADQSMIDYTLYPLDIYNDAANRALSNLHSQFLYDEIEAEVNLCFDQLIFKLSEKVYKAYKTQAASLYLDNPIRSQLEQQLAVNARFHAPKMRFAGILSQRHYQLLGRFVDLNHIVSQRMNNLLRKNIDNAISRFEAKDLSSIIELDTQLDVIRITHALLAKHFTQLDNFDAIFNEVNDSVSLVSYHSRIAFHVISEVASDFLPNYNYNSYSKRFIRSIISFSDPVQRDHGLPSQQPHFMYGNKMFTVAFGAILANTSKFFGLPHVKALINIVGASNVTLIVDECLNHLELKINNILVPYVSELLSAMPPNSKCPLYDYKVAGGLGYFSGKLMDLIRYPPLQTDVFQHFKEMGNAIAFMQLIDLGLEQLTAERFVVTAPFYKLNPTNLTNPPSSEAAPLYHYSSKLAQNLQENSDPSEVTTVPIVLDAIWVSDHFYRKPANSSLFKAALDRVYMMIDGVRAEWDQQTPEEGAVIPVECAREFYRLFSAMKYIFCSPPERGQGEYDNFDLFGDGFFWAGLSIIHFLGQRKRFLCFDFVDHLLRIAEVHPNDPNDKKVAGFTNNGQFASNLSKYIFSILETFVPEYQPFICLLHPPEDDSDVSQFKIASTVVDNLGSPNPTRPDAAVLSPRTNTPRSTHSTPRKGEPAELPPPPSHLPPPPPKNVPGNIPPPPRPS